MRFFLDLKKKASAHFTDLTFSFLLHQNLLCIYVWKTYTCTPFQPRPLLKWILTILMIFFHILLYFVQLTHWRRCHKYFLQTAAVHKKGRLLTLQLKNDKLNILILFDFTIYLHSSKHCMGFVSSHNTLGNVSILSSVQTLQCEI